jgi:hypothetical protein
VLRLSPEGGAPQRVTPEGTVAASASACGDGSIVYQTFKDDHTTLWHMAADGSNPRLIIGDGDPLGPSCADGKTVVFTARLRDVVTVRHVSLTGGEPTDVMTNVLAGRAELSPDGTMIASQVWENTASPVHVVKTSGGAPLFNLRLPASARAIQWAPDGTALRYIATRQGADNIWEQPLKGGAPKQLTTFPDRQIGDFAWSRDGKHLVVSRGSFSTDVVLMTNFN